MVAAIQADIFTPQQLKRVNAYAVLAALALLGDRFYEKQAIQIRTMPATDIQQSRFASFRRQVNEVINALDHQVTNIVEAEQLV